MIAVEDATLRRAGRAALEGVTLRVAKGTFVGLVGPNGAGKSTLMRVFSGELGLSAGTAIFDGRDVARWRPDALARRRALLAQQNAVAFDIAARDLVALGRLPHEGHATRARNAAAIDRALALADATHLETRNYATLSGGEQQRVQFARALAQIDGVADPVLLLDEPTAGLDLAHQRAVLLLARAMVATGTTVVVVLHDLLAASIHCERIVVLSDGQLVADGPPRQALDPALVARVFGVQSAWAALPSGGEGLIVC